MKSTLLNNASLGNPSKNYSDREMLILRSWALGMGELEIQRLMGINAETYQQHQNTILTKLEVMNCYTAVTKAFRLRLIARKEYTAESIKTFALSFAYKKTEYGSTVETETTKKDLWELYDTLVDFESYLEMHFFQTTPVKKNPTEAG